MRHILGDADEVAVLVASLLKASGYKTRFVLVDEHHVYVEFQSPETGDWLPVEPSNPLR